MIVFVLHRYWNTPDNEGADVVGVYRDVEGAIDDMKSPPKRSNRIIQRIIGSQI